MNWTTFGYGISWASTLGPIFGPNVMGLSSTEFLATIALLALWRAPDWGRKVLDLAEAIRDFRDRSRRHEWTWRRDDDVDDSLN